MVFVNATLLKTVFIKQVLHPFVWVATVVFTVNILSVRVFTPMSHLLKQNMTQMTQMARGFIVSLNFHQ